MESSYKRQSVEKYILKVLQSLGGSAPRSKIKEEIVSDEDNNLFYNDVFGLVSLKNGGSYVPFNYDFNFGIKHLFLYCLVESYKRGNDITLTEAGRAINYRAFPSKEQKQIIDKGVDAVIACAPVMIQALTGVK